MAAVPSGPHSGLVTSVATWKVDSVARGSMPETSIFASRAMGPPPKGSSAPDSSRNLTPRALGDARAAVASGAPPDTKDELAVAVVEGSAYQFSCAVSCRN